MIKFQLFGRISDKKEPKPINLNKSLPINNNERQKKRKFNKKSNMSKKN